MWGDRATTPHPPIAMVGVISQPMQSLLCVFDSSWNRDIHIFFDKFKNV